MVDSSALPDHWFHRFARGSALAVAAIGSAVLVGWAFDVPALKGILPGLATMKANTALAFLAAGTALALSVPPRPKLPGRATAAFVGLLGLLTLAQDVFGFDLGIDGWLVRTGSGTATNPHPGRMAPATAANFALFGLAILLLDAPALLGWVPAQPPALLATASALVALAGYAYGVEALYHTGPYSSVAAHTAAAFLVLGLGVLAARPRCGVMALVASRTAGGLVVRRQLPTLVVALFAIGYVRLAGERAGYYGTAFGLALMVVGSGAVFAALVVWTGRAAHALDLRLRAAEADARDRAELLRATLASIGDGVVTTDAGGRVVFLNAVAEALTGWPRGEAAGRPLDEVFRIVSADTRDPVANPAYRALREGAVIGLANHTLLVARDGAEHPIDDCAAPIRTPDARVGGAVLVFRDVTARYAAEESLRAVMESVPDAVITLDAGGVVRSANPAAGRVFGYAAEDLVGRTAEELMPGAFAAGADGRLAPAAEARAGTDREVAGRRRDGSTFPADLSVTEFRLGAERRFTGVVRDSTARKHLEDQFRQAQKMEAVGRLAGGVAHDFNNLLTVINGYADLLLAAAPPAHRDRPPLEAIREAGRRAAGLTGQLLAFSRKSLVEPKVLDLNAVVARSAQLLKPLIGEDVVLSAPPAPGLARVKADAGQIEQIVLNLAVNARDAMPHGGRLTIETANVQLRAEDAIAYPNLAPGRYVQLAVSDTGVGMTEAVQAQVFEPFFTTKEPGHGTGLGLAMVYGAVKAHGGYVGVYSEVGSGTTFKILLPATAETATEAGAAEAGPARGTETVLLVEDEDTVRRFGQLALEAYGYTVLEAAGGAEGIARAAEHAGPIHLLITDVIMPEVGGREVAAATRRARPDMKVLYMSGYTDEAVVRHGIVAAADAFLQKPFTPRSLARKVRAVLDSPP